MRTLVALTFATTTIAFVSLGVALPESDAFAQGKSLKEQLVGTWTMVSVVTARPDGSRYEALGPNPRGVFILNANGHFAITIIGDAHRKFASNNRLQGTPEENEAAVHSSIAYFGTYTVSEADHTLNFHIDRCTFPNWDGTDQKRSVTITGDEMKYSNAAASGGGKAELVWKREK
jgi:Lipocalin-like domain